MFQFIICHFENTISVILILNKQNKQENFISKTQTIVEAGREEERGFFISIVPELIGHARLITINPNIEKNISFFNMLP